MRELVAALKEKQGRRTQIEFAAELGVGNTYLSGVYRGHKTIGLPLSRRIVALYPELEPLVTAHILRKEECNGEEAAG